MRASTWIWSFVLAQTLLDLLVVGG